MFNCGMMAIELPEDKIQALFEFGAGKATQLRADVESQTLIATDDAGKELKIEFPISQFDKTLVETGGWVEFADKNY
jgi:3-isopropylmalate/(R)-2-methylmalate dehydratase small subunit